MQLIISPTKTMRTAKVDFQNLTQPQFKAQMLQIWAQLQRYSIDELQALWHCNLALATQNFTRLHEDALISGPAILMYQGLQFQNMQVEAMNPTELQYLQANLWIVSGMYGLLRPFDEIQPYRLEMQTRLAIGEHKNIYAFWADRLYQTLFATPTNLIVNLASNEYAKSIKKYLHASDQFIDVIFLVKRNDKYVQQATIAKQARGRMVQFCAINQVTTLAQIKKFSELGFMYDTTRSNEREIVFIQV